jgi:hypothetical protein
LKQKVDKCKGHGSKDKDKDNDRDRDKDNSAPTASRTVHMSCAA